MQRLQTEDKRLRSNSGVDVQQFNAFKTLEDPAHRWSSSGLVDLIGDGLPCCLQLLTQAMFRQTVHQQGEHHDQAQGHDAFWLFHKDRGRQEQRNFQETEAPFDAALLQIQADQLIVGHLGFLHHIAGDDKAGFALGVGQQFAFVEDDLGRDTPAHPAWLCIPRRPATLGVL